MRMRQHAAIAIAAIGSISATARAHVVSSPDDNNRYLDITPLPDRVRLAYTVLFGDKPGAALRKQLDRDHDGAISGDEAGAFGANLSHEVADSLRVEIDHVVQPVTWHTVDVGITPQTAGGAFSVDLVAWLCLPAVGGAHQLALRDQLRLDHPGETELKVEDTPAIALRRVRIGAVDDPDHDFKFVGAGGPLADSGLELAFEVDPGAHARALDDGACDAARPSQGGGAPWIAIGVGALVAVGIGGGVVLRRRRT